MKKLGWLMLLASFSTFFSSAQILRRKIPDKMVVLTFDGRTDLHRAARSNKIYPGKRSIAKY